MYLKRRPALPEYSNIWDVNIMLKYLSSLSKTSSLLLRGKMPPILFLLLSAQKFQALHLICLEDIEIHSENLIIKTNQLFKESKPVIYRQLF